jgi:hypothetical protein
MTSTCNSQIRALWRPFSVFVFRFGFRFRSRSRFRFQLSVFSSCLPAGLYVTLCSSLKWPSGPEPRNLSHLNSSQHTYQHCNPRLEGNCVNSIVWYATTCSHLCMITQLGVYIQWISGCLSERKLRYTEAIWDSVNDIYTMWFNSIVPPLHSFCVCMDVSMKSNLKFTVHVRTGWLRESKLSLHIHCSSSHR